MAKEPKDKKKLSKRESKRERELALEEESFNFKLKEGTLRLIIAISCFVIGVLLILAALNLAGVGGQYIYEGLRYLVGIGYYLLPLLAFLLSIAQIRSYRPEIGPLRSIASVLFFLSGLGLIGLLSPEESGVIGRAVAHPIMRFLDLYAGLIVVVAIMSVSLVVLLDTHIDLDILSAVRSLRNRMRRIPEEGEMEPTVATYQPDNGSEDEFEDDQYEDTNETTEPVVESPAPAVAGGLGAMIGGALAGSGALAGGFTGLGAATSVSALFTTYTPPPLSLLERDRGKPATGDTKANANIIKRTLQNFGIQVEMDEISVGPTVTRYALKPAEGVRISKIVSLQSNLELTLAASPIRIEAPIPGKSLVGIEVPNTAKAMVGLGAMLSTDSFADNPKPLMVAVGRDITGAPHYADIAKMPHSLVAGSTGSGKSVTMHAFITSLLYRNGPEALRFILIDPKRVELTLYNDIPHLLTPVITDPKKAVLALKWATKEMERRYNVLETERVRDIGSYHLNILAPARAEYERNKNKKGADSDDESKYDLPEPMPYIVIVVDELADLMQAYPRELEATIVRLAQMSRAVGIHLVLSTQRPSVNVITGLIKANIPTRFALQVASQIDSRTIIDQGGAEKLLGAGDMLYLSGEMAKPLRLQSPYINENELKRVVQFIVKNNDYLPEAGIDFAATAAGSGANSAFASLEDSDGGDDDSMYEEARLAVVEAGKASTSYLQRKLKIGYSRAARIMDILEERGVIGPADGSKPREVLDRGGATTAPSGAEEADF